jgi:protein-tyrosine phosphatase
MPVALTQVWERLFLGGRGDAEYLGRSNPVGITTVISVCEEKVLRRNPGIKYVHIPIADATPITVGHIDAIIDAIAENIRWGKILVRCGRGMSRSSVMAAAWMHVVGYKNIDVALAEIKELSPIISPSSILLASVKEFLR